MIYHDLFNDSGKVWLRQSQTVRAKWGSVSSYRKYPACLICWGMLLMANTCSICKWEFAVTVGVAKQYEPTTPAAVLVHHTFTFGRPVYALRWPVPQKMVLYRFIWPLVWKVATQLKKIPGLEKKLSHDLRWLLGLEQFWPNCKNKNKNKKRQTHTFVD